MELEKHNYEDKDPININTMIEELENLSNQWGCDGCDDIMEEFECEEKHINSILKEYKDLYTKMTYSVVGYGDYYNAHIFSFLDLENNLEQVIVEIEDC